MKLFGLTIPKQVYMPIIIICFAIILEHVLKSIITKLFKPKKRFKSVDEKRLKTLSSMFKNIARYIVWIVAFLAILGVFGVNTAAILTGLGVVSLVIGLAFQDILKDVFAGISILFENLFSIGDLIKIDDFQGTVISIGLKTTRIQAATGQVKMIANRNISEVINYSVDNTVAVVDIPVCYEAKIDKVEKILNVTAATLKDKIPELVEDVKLVGVQELGDSAVIFRLTGKCKPAKHFQVERIMKKEFKNSLDKNGIKIPYPQIEVHNEK